MQSEQETVMFEVNFINLKKAIYYEKQKKKEQLKKKRNCKKCY